LAADSAALRLPGAWFPPFPREANEPSVTDELARNTPARVINPIVRLGRLRGDAGASSVANSVVPHVEGHVSATAALSSTTSR
jgi:hypothetical protein